MWERESSRGPGGGSPGKGSRVQRLRGGGGKRGGGARGGAAGAPARRGGARGGCADRRAPPPPALPCVYVETKMAAAVMALPVRLRTVSQ